jgi:NAD(P)-dependent dehydrogenase (short-subunit alcohol dehydrogenase family)
MKRFEGKAVLVTGAGSGIGKATALRFAREGGHVICADINDEGVQATVTEIEQADGKAFAVHCDVSNPEDAAKAVQLCIDKFGKLDVLASIAGVGGFYRTSDTTLEIWNRMIGVNLTGTFLMCSQALPHLLASKGTIVTTASVAGLKSHPYSAAYCASKGGVVQLTKALAVEYARKGVRVNCVCPGGVDTPLVKQFTLPPGGSQMALMRIAPIVDRHATTDEVASAILFLSSDEASYINGTTLVVDAAMSA